MVQQASHSVRNVLSSFEMVQVLSKNIICKLTLHLSAVILLLKILLQKVNYLVKSRDVRYEKFLVSVYWKNYIDIIGIPAF